MMVDNWQDRASTPSTYPSITPQTSYPAHASDVDSSRTLQLSEIPKRMDELLFRQYLISLPCQPGVKTEILGFSLGLFRDWNMATVSFVNEPLVFRECHPGFRIHVQLPDEPKGKLFTVDCDFHGMTILYHPPSNIEYDLIAVSGLSSHAFGSWKSPSQRHVMWLRDHLKLDFPQCRVFIWGYDSELESSATKNIRNYARQLLTAIQVVREGNEIVRRRPIIFVGHSLGGLVIKQVRLPEWALVEAARSREVGSYDKATLESCVGLFLFGVPNKGLNEKNLLSMVKGKQSAPFVANLMEESQLLDALHADFRDMYKKFLNSCYVVSFYEMKDTPTVEKTTDGKWRRNPDQLIRMVTKESAIGCTSFVDDCNQIGFDLDHSKLVKFTSRGDNNYLTVCSKMKELVEKRPSQLLSPDIPTAGKLHTHGVQLAHNVLNNRFQETNRGIRSMLDGFQQWFANFRGSTYQQATRLSESRAYPILDATPQCISEVRSASKILYKALSPRLRCSCHELYMCLEIVPPATGAKLQPPAQFSVLITNDGVVGAPAGRHMRLNIVQELSQVALTCGEPVSLEAILCRTTPHDTIDASENFLDGFQLYHSSSDNTADIGERRSLEELLKEKSNSLVLAETLGLGLNLGKAALHFHSSPWIKSWSMETVSVFITSGTQRTDSLVLYIPSKHTAENREALKRTGLIGGAIVFDPDWELNLVLNLLQIGLLAGGGSVRDKDMESLFEIVRDLRVYISRSFDEEPDF
ncbi:hypothetical protein BDD12DRAFT_861595 [Trichophaea hybrida]|nr:hypothetical protein BDD12DRAFT_861595 [Trichophaea hybrida]